MNIYDYKTELTCKPMVHQESRTGCQILHNWTDVLTIGAKNKAASATLEVIITSGWYFSRHSTIGAAPR